MTDVNQFLPLLASWALKPKMFEDMRRIMIGNTFHVLVVSWPLAQLYLLNMDLMLKPKWQWPTKPSKAKIFVTVVTDLFIFYEF